MIVCIIGIVTNIINTRADAFMGDGTALSFYTIQSNILVLVTECVLLIYSCLNIKNNSKLQRGIYILKYVTTVAITLTFLVFWGMLAPYMDFETMLKPSSIIVHLVVPILMMLDFVSKDNSDIRLKKEDILYVLIPPFSYLTFCLIRAEVSDKRLTGGSRYPYWFIDLDMFGWFGNENGIGVIYWVGLVSILTLSIGYGMMKLKRRKEK